nr:hypothetical protein [Tanacetum cinerariifolium]
MPRQSIFIINMLSLQVVHDPSTIISRVSNLLRISGRQGAKISPLSQDDADDEDEEESSDSEEEEEEHLAPTVPAPALYSS